MKKLEDLSNMTVAFDDEDYVANYYPVGGNSDPSR
jgi:hypothetical protein